MAVFDEPEEIEDFGDLLRAAARLRPSDFSTIHDVIPSTNKKAYEYAFSNCDLLEERNINWNIRMDSLVREGFEDRTRARTLALALRNYRDRVMPGGIRLPPMPASVMSEHFNILADRF